MNPFELPKDFQLGVATASTQIEGGDTGNTWYEWCNSGHIKDGTSCFTACDHWNRVEEDTELLFALNVHTYRMSLEWSRIEPEQGVFKDDVIRHYRNEIMLLNKKKIKPIVTLHHFSDPVWFIKIGGWKVERNISVFINYVKYVIENLGDIVSDWITFNEPNVYNQFGYVFGTFPPGIRNVFTSLKVQTNLIKTHILLYKLIHNIRTERNYSGQTTVGFAMHIRIFDGITPFGKLLAGLVDYLFNELILTGMATGNLMMPLSLSGHRCKKGVYMDFLGINYYTRNIVEFELDPRKLFYNLKNDNKLDQTDLGWDIYPIGIYKVSQKYYQKYKLPIFITENGISDALDNRRANFIANHLYFISKAIKDGINVKRYYHWTLMDNFEWLEGESANFGLYKCDFNDQSRKLRNSGEFYSIICENNELTMQQIEEQIQKSGICEDDSRKIVSSAESKNRREMKRQF